MRVGAGGVRYHEWLTMKGTGAPFTFATPKAQELRAYLEGHAPRGGGRRLPWMPLVALGAALALLFTTQEGWAALGALGVLAVLVGWNAVQRRRVLGLERQLVKVHELSLQRQWPAALSTGWALLPKLRRLPDLFARTVAFIAYGLDEQGAFESAIVGYDFLLKRMPTEHPGAMLLTIQRAMAQLAVDRLTDADESLRRLRHLEQWPGSGMSAAYCLAMLWQMVRTQHYADAVGLEERLVQRLRPLGVEAGYGYGLMALARWRLSAEAGAAGGESRGTGAEEWWRRATLLLPVAALTRKFADLEPMARVLKATEPFPSEEGGRDAG